MEQRSYHRDLKADLFAAQSGTRRPRFCGAKRGTVRSARSALVEAIEQFTRSLDQIATLPGTDLPCLGVMAREQLLLVLRNLTESVFKGFGNAGVQRPSRLP